MEKIRNSLLGLVVCLVSCGSKTEIEQLTAELEVVKKQNLLLEKRLNEYENALVITADDLNDYLISLTFGLSNGNHTKESPFSTYIALSQLPSNLKVDWECSPEPMKVEHDGLVYHVANFYETGRATEFKGS